eukprot:1049766-Prymnesium_polylepis.1
MAHARAGAAGARAERERARDRGMLEYHIGDRSSVGCDEEHHTARRTRTRGRARARVRASCTRSARDGTRSRRSCGRESVERERARDRGELRCETAETPAHDCTLPRMHARSDIHSRESTRIWTHAARSEARSDARSHRDADGTRTLLVAVEVTGPLQAIGRPFTPAEKRARRGEAGANGPMFGPGMP